MHIIPDERALAHWRSLCCLPPATASRMRTRFLGEQPALAGTILMVSGGTMEGPDGKRVVRPSNDPELVDFLRLSETAAQLAEIFRREAGRAPRKVEGPEANELIETHLALFLRFKEAAARGENLAKEIFDGCSQPNLLAGVTAALGSDPKVRKERVMLDCLLLRVTIDGLHRACGGDATPNANDWDAERVLFALSAQGDPMRHAALMACEQFRAELMPELTEELSGWASDPVAALEVDGSLGMHALYLLAKWRETSAWPSCRNLFSLPGDAVNELLGDFIVDDASIVLAMIAGEKRDELRAMIEDGHLDKSCRIACVDALTCQVAWGEWPRAELVAYLRELLTGKLPAVPENEFVFGGVVSAACDLEAWELLPEIEAAYERGVVDEDFMELGHVRKVAARKHPDQWRYFCERHTPVDNVAARTNWLDRPPELIEPLPPLSEYPPLADSAMPYQAPPKVGRNDPCPCGSGKKFKKCCGG